MMALRYASPITAFRLPTADWGFQLHELNEPYEPLLPINQSTNQLFDYSTSLVFQPNEPYEPNELNELHFQ